MANAGNQTMDEDGDCLKSDLRLRSEFPYLVTRIFQLKSLEYVIVFDKNQIDCQDISELFHKSIRPVTAFVKISNSVPTNFKREISPINDQSISKDFVSLYLTNSDIINILSARFPELDLVDTRTPRGGLIQLVVQTLPDLELRLQVQSFMDGLKTCTTEIIQDVAAHPNVKFEHHSSWHIAASKLRSKQIKFVRDDEQFWFTNIDRIYGGHFNNNPIPGTNNLGSSCLIDFSYGSEQLNIRQALLYYDTVLVVPPLIETADSWTAQNLSDDECIKLVEAKRLKFVLTQPEERSDTHLLEKAYEVDQGSVLGRRTTAAVILRDLVQTAEEYQLNEKDLIIIVPEICKYLSEDISTPADDLAKFILWPLSALRQSFHPLMTNGALGSSAFGQDQYLANQYLKASGRDLTLEIMAAGSQTHLAHAFKATMIPYVGQPESWLWIYRTIGDRLNFFRSFNKRIAAAWAANERRKESQRSVIQPLPLFEFDSTVPISEFIQITSLNSLRHKGRALLTRLADMPLENRDIEINHLIKQMNQLKSQKSGLFSLENLEDIGPITDFFTGYSAPPFFAMRNFVGRVARLREKSKTFDNFIDLFDFRINKFTGRNEDLDFLSQVDRVAQLRRKRII